MVERRTPAVEQPTITNPDLTIKTDASLLGWGAVAEGANTGGLWSEEERQSHINHLELMGAALAVQTYTKDETISHVHLRMDNRTAVCYINHMGGTRSPVQHCRTQPANCGSGAWKGD